jgi:TetR/AcrR family transcriptional repressor of mexJK operon
MVHGYRAELVQRKRQQILPAASRLFTQRGLDGTTMDAVAAAAGVSKQTLYRYFPSKEQLLIAVMRAMSVESIFGSAAATLPPNSSRRVLEQKLIGLARDLSRRLMTPEYLDLARLVLGESGRRPELADMFRATVAGTGQEGLTSLLTQARSLGLVRADVDIAVAVRVFAGALLTWVIGSGVLAGSRPALPPTVGTLRHLVRIVLDGVAV